MSNQLGVTVDGVYKIGTAAFLTINGVHREVKSAFLTVGGVHRKCFEGDAFAALLTDFEYTNNGDGTVTLTKWKGTSNGAASTELIIPDDERIIL